MAGSTVAFKNMDEARVRSMNRASKFKPALYKQATVKFSNVDIRAREDGQAAVLTADVEYRLRVQARYFAFRAAAARGLADEQDAERVDRQSLMPAPVTCAVTGRPRAVPRRCRPSPAAPRRRRRTR